MTTPIHQGMPCDPLDVTRPYAEIVARVKAQQGTPREIAEHYQCQHRDRTGRHEGEHDLSSDLIFAGAPASLRSDARRYVRQIERDAIACFLEGLEPAGRTLPRWAGWIPVAIVVLVVVAAVAWKVVTR